MTSLLGSLAKKNNILNRVKMRKKGFVYDKVDFKNYDKKEFFLKKIAKKHKNFTLVIEKKISSKWLFETRKCS